MENLELLVKKLINTPNETPWLEFKHNNYEPEMIGKDISALANSAALHNKEYAYMIWGINDKTHEIVGTEYNLQTLKQGQQELESWLRNLLSKNTNFNFYSVTIENKNVGILMIDKIISTTSTFKKTAYIRIGSYTKILNEHPQVESQLWDKLHNNKFEEQSAKQDLTLQDALQYLDYTKYFDFIKIPQPDNITEIAHYLKQEEIIKQQENELFAITNMGAMLFAKKLADFNKISRKAMRIVQYENNNKLNLLKEETNEQGYVVSFENIIKYIEALIPSREVISGATREKITAYPIIAVREAVANALIHQDFSITGTGPIIEIFQNRIEITNPGIPLIDIARIIDNPPKSRNEKLASLMRRLKMCEELGTGWDKIVSYCEAYKLPAPKIELYENNTKVTLFAHRNFSDIPYEEKIQACYLHACIKYIQEEYLTNASLRERFNLSETSTSSISRLIKDTLQKKYIKPLDPHTAPRYMKYVPYWA